MIVGLLFGLLVSKNLLNCLSEMSAQKDGLLLLLRMVKSKDLVMTFDKHFRHLFHFICMTG